MCVYIYMYALEFFEILKSNKSPYMRKFSKSYGSTPNLIGTRDQFCGRQFFHGPGFGVGMDLGWFKFITCIVHIISIIITSAPPQIIRL